MYLMMYLNKTSQVMFLQRLLDKADELEQPFPLSMIQVRACLENAKLKGGLGRGGGDFLP